MGVSVSTDIGTQGIVSDYELHPNLVNQWKRLAVVKLQEAFSSRHDREAEKEEELRDRLYREIGQLKVELDWLKKKSGLHN